MQYSMSTENSSPSTWDDGKRYVYKKSSYNYSQTGGYNNNLPQLDKSLDKNVSQLDALLDDLKNERHMSREQNYSTYKTTKSTEHRSSDISGDLIKKAPKLQSSHGIDDVDNYKVTSQRTIRSVNHVNPDKYDEHIGIDDGDNYKVTSQRTIRSVNHVNPDKYDERTYASTQIFPRDVSQNKSVEIVNMSTKESQGNTQITTTNTELEKDIKSIALSDDILPLPGTRVTTTVRTYTYEVPSGGTITDTNLYDHSIKSTQSKRIVPATVVYNAQSHSNIHNNNEEPLPSTTNQMYEFKEQRHYSESSNPLRETTDQYTTTRDNVYPNTNQTHYSKTTVTHTDVPPPVPTTYKYVYNKSSNTTNTVNGISPRELPYPDYPLHPVPDDHQDTVRNKYSSYSIRTVRDVEPEVPSSNLPLTAFPLDGIDAGTARPNHPQRVDDLMQSFENNTSYSGADVRTTRKNEIQTAVASPTQQHVPTTNRLGREVYYPPGHDVMLTKREEMSAGSAAGGRWAKASGSYEYESGQKSKSKTKSGGAIVPVCLPLCCAMPCSIM